MKMSLFRLAAFGLLAAAAAPVAAQDAAPPPTAPATASGDEQWPEAWFEIFRLAPGRQEEFIRRIARADEVARAGGQPPIQMFVHQDGADWDVLLYKPVRNVQPTAEQRAAMDRRRRELGVESGPAYFVAIRELIASHTDTKTYGPITAGQWLARLDRWRREHPAR